ncbi:MAG: hypothetical protein ACR2RV_13025 [Verrucomicrobiales bacterium]
MASAAVVGAHPEVEVQLAHVSAQIEDSPGSAELYLQRGHIHRVHRDWKAGMTDYRRAGELDPELHRVSRAIGRLLLEAGKAEQALPQLEQFLKHQPGDPEGQILRGRAQGRLGEHLIGAADFDAALPKLRRPTPELYIERARILFEGGERYQARAIAGLEQGIERLGDLYTLHRYAAELEIEADQPEAALRRARVLLKKFDGNVSWRIFEAELLVALERKLEARVSYCKALETIAALPPHRQRTPAVSEKKQLIGEALAELDPEQ